MAEVFKALGEKDPRQIAGYRLAAKLGSGGMGKVYLSYTPAGRPVAIKVVRPDLSEDPEFRSRFRREVEAAKRVHGLYTAPVIDAETEGDTPWLATAYVPGPSLQSVITDHGPLPVPTVLLLIAGMAEALAAVHEAGIVHRDFKPSNVLLAADGPRVIDFGISRAVDSSSLTGSGMTIGTPSFMSPEQAEASDITVATDIFALGQVACFAACGAPAFGDGTPHGVLYRVVHKKPDLSAVPDPLHEIIGRCLEKEPAARPSPAEIIALCRAAAPGAELRRAEDWLPPAVAADLSSRAAGPAPTGALPHDDTVARPRAAGAVDGAADARSPATGPADGARGEPGPGAAVVGGFGPPPQGLADAGPAAGNAPHGPSTGQPAALAAGGAGDGAGRAASGAVNARGRRRVAALVAAAVLVVGGGAAAAYYIGKGDDGERSAQGQTDRSAPPGAGDKPSGKPSRGADEPAGSGPGSAPSGGGDREGTEPTGVPSAPVSRGPGVLSPKGVDYEDVSLPDGYHLTLAADRLRPDNSPHTAEDFAYVNPAGPGGGSVPTVAGGAPGADGSGAGADTGAGARVRTADGGKLVLLRADEYGSATSCRDTTRFTSEIDLAKLAPGSRVCVLAASGDVALITYQGAAPPGDPSDYISLDVTVWRATAPRA